MAEYLEEQLKRMSPRVRRTRRKQTKRETGGGKRTKHTDQKEHSRILNTASMHHSAA